VSEVATLHQLGLAPSRQTNPEAMNLVYRNPFMDVRRHEISERTGKPYQGFVEKC
jgi:hypothetical protein